MDNKKIFPYELTEAELREHLKNDTQSPIANDEMLLFIAEFDLKYGVYKVAADTIYDMYKGWSKPPRMTKYKFFLKFNMYFQRTTRRHFLLNKDPILLANAGLIQLAKTKTNKTKSPTYRKHFEAFLKNCNLSKGTYWLEAHILRDLYDEYTYNNGIHPIGLHQFNAFLKMYFEFKVPKNECYYFGIDKKKLKNLTEERMVALRETRNKLSEKSRQKTRHKALKQQKKQKV